LNWASAPANQNTSTKTFSAACSTTEVEERAVRAEVEERAVRAEVEERAVRAEVEERAVRAEVEERPFTFRAALRTTNSGL
jgi:hypothetical protein